MTGNDTIYSLIYSSLKLGLLDTNTASDMVLRVEPEVEDLEYAVEPHGIRIKRSFEGDVEYTLTLESPHLYDIYRQRSVPEFSTNFSFARQSPEIRQVRGTVYVDREEPVLRFQTINVSNVTIVYQAVSSVYYSALALYDGNVPVPVNRITIPVDSPDDKIVWQTPRF